MRSSIIVFKRKCTDAQMLNIMPQGYIAILQPSSQFVYTWVYRYYIRSCPLNEWQLMVPDLFQHPGPSPT